jgi:hypothetical protein
MTRKDTEIKSYDKIAPKGKIPKKRVYICSPLKGKISRNILNARLYCRFAYDKGFVPLAPHIYFTQFLDETKQEERLAGMRYGLELMWQVREVWVFGEYISEGMRAEIDLAKDLKIPIRYFDYDMEECK